MNSADIRKDVGAGYRLTRFVFDPLCPLYTKLPRHLGLRRLSAKRSQSVTQNAHIFTVSIYAHPVDKASII